MTVGDVIRFLEEVYPRQYAEDFDNTGLLVGDEKTEVKGILVTHDTTDAVLDEAIATGKNLIVSFHPLIFKGLKAITGADYVQKAVIKAIRHNISVYSPHTAVDNHHRGVSYLTAKALGLENIRILLPKQGSFMQLVTYVPHAHAEKVRQAVFAAGAGKIGNYDECSFNIQGTGTFRPDESANPFVGERGKRHEESETRISVVFPAHLTSSVLRSMLQAHPYEEPAYEIFRLKNPHPEIGIGSIGEFPGEMSEENFLAHVKTVLGTPVLRHSSLRGKPVKKVALVGGSGAFAIDTAKKQGADAFVSGDFKYHDFFKGGKDMLLVDAGHYESERFTAGELVRILSEKFPNFAVAETKVNVNPINYYQQ